MGKTAAELMADLAKNKEFNARQDDREKYFADLKEKYAKDEALLVDELNQAGFSVRSVWDFVNTKNLYLEAEPILVAHLKVKHHPKILAGIARSLAAVDFSGNDELWKLLIDLYQKTPPDSEIDIPEERGAQEAIAVALECLVNESRLNDLSKLITTIPNGDGIEWLRRKIE